MLRREDVYKEFIEQASKCYVDALQRGETEADIPGLVTLYALIGRMRIMSTPKVVGIADQIGRKIVDSYLAPDKSFLELREMVKSANQSILSANSARPAARNSNRFAPCNCEPDKCGLRIADISIALAEADIHHCGDTSWNGIYPFIDYSTGGNIDRMIKKVCPSLKGTPLRRARLGLIWINFPAGSHA